MEQRIKRSNAALADEWKQKLAAKAAKEAADEQAEKAAARAKLEGKAVRIEGFPHSDYNGLYTHDSDDEGWPVLKNAHGKFYYRWIVGCTVSGLHPAIERELRTGAGRKRKRLPDHAFPLAFADHDANDHLARGPWLVQMSQDAKFETHSLTVALVSE